MARGVELGPRPAPSPLAGSLSKASVMALAICAISRLVGFGSSSIGDGTRCTIVAEGCGACGGGDVSEVVLKNEKGLSG